MHKNDKDEFRTAIEALLKYVGNSLVSVSFSWELGIAMNSLLPGSSQIMFCIWCVQNEHWRSCG